MNSSRAAVRSLRFRLFIPILVVLLLGLGMVSSVDTVTAVASDTPPSFEAEVEIGQSVTLNKSVSVAPRTPVVRVFFLADTTGSTSSLYESALPELWAHACASAFEIFWNSPGAWFGAAQYNDNSVGAGFWVTWPATLDPGLACDLMPVTWGAHPEDDGFSTQLHALQQLSISPYWGGIADAKYVIWYGDAPGLDPSHGVAESDAIAALQAAGITVIAVPMDSGHGYGLDDTGQASRITAATGGAVLIDPSEVAQFIDDSLPFVPLTLTPDASGCTPLDVTFAPTSVTVTNGENANFVETISVPNEPLLGGTSITCTVEFRDQYTALHGVQTISVQIPSLNEPPDCTGAAPTVSEISPPNQKMVPVGVLGVTDPDGDAVTITINSIHQDEPVSEPSSGSTSPDGIIAGSIAEVRAERDGGGNGRVYEISFDADDGNGGSCSGSVQVGVPHDQKPGNSPVDDGQVFDSTAS